MRTGKRLLRMTVVLLVLLLVMMPVLQAFAVPAARPRVETVRYDKDCYPGDYAVYEVKVVNVKPEDEISYQWQWSIMEWTTNYKIGPDWIGYEWADDKGYYNMDEGTVNTSGYNTSRLEVLLSENSLYWEYEDAVVYRCRVTVNGEVLYSDQMIETCNPCEYLEWVGYDGLEEPINGHPFDMQIKETETEQFAVKEIVWYQLHGNNRMTKMREKDACVPGSYRCEIKLEIKDGYQFVTPLLNSVAYYEETTKTTINGYNCEVRFSPKNSREVTLIRYFTVGLTNYGQQSKMRHPLERYQFFYADKDESAERILVRTAVDFLEIEDDGYWLKTSYNGQIGYFHSSGFGPASQEDAGENYTPEYFATTESCSLYDEPGGAAAVIGSVPAGTLMVYIETSGSWTKVYNTLTGQTGWIAKGSLAASVDNRDWMITPQPYTLSGRKNAAVYAEDSTDSAVLGTVEPGTVATVTGKVTHYGTDYLIIDYNGRPAYVVAEHWDRGEFEVDPTTGEVIIRCKDATVTIGGQTVSGGLSADILNCDDFVLVKSALTDDGKMELEYTSVDGKQLSEDLNRDTVQIQSAEYELESVERDDAVQILRITLTRKACLHKEVYAEGAVEGSCETEAFSGDIYCKECKELLTANTSLGKQHGELSVIGYQAPSFGETGYTGDTYCLTCGEKVKTGETLPALKAEDLIQIRQEAPGFAMTSEQAAQYLQGADSFAMENGSVISYPAGLPLEIAYHLNVDTILTENEFSTNTWIFYGKVSDPVTSYVSAEGNETEAAASVILDEPAIYLIRQVADIYHNGEYAGSVETDLFVDARSTMCAHDYSLTCSTATCMADGRAWYTCSKCGDVIEEPAKQLEGHVYADQYKSTRDGCAKVCVYCGQAAQTEAHDLQQIAQSVQCTKTITTKACSRCGYVVTEERKTGAHTFAKNGKDYYTDGQYHIRVCTVCGEVVKEKHSFKSQSAPSVKGGTVARGGLEEHDMRSTTCAVCGYQGSAVGITGAVCGYGTIKAVLTGAKTADASTITSVFNHAKSYYWMDSTTNNAFAYGTSTKVPASARGHAVYVFVNTENDQYRTVPVKLGGHALVTVEGFEGDCKTPGVIQHKVCAFCGGHFDMSGKTITEYQRKTDHVYADACDTTCDVCGNVRTIEHSFGDTIKADSVCHFKQCSVCGTKEQIAAHADLFWTDGADATCAQPGTRELKCGACMQTIAVQTKCAEHAYEMTSSVQTGCDTDGTIVLTCRRCGDSITMTLPARGHNVANVEEFPATCVADGIAAHGVCVSCGTLFSMQPDGTVGEPTTPEALRIPADKHHHAGAVVLARDGADPVYRCACGDKIRTDGTETANYLWILWVVLGILLLAAAAFLLLFFLKKKKKDRVDPEITEEKTEE